MVRTPRFVLKVAHVTGTCLIYSQLPFALMRATAVGMTVHLGLSLVGYATRIQKAISHPCHAKIKTVRAISNNWKPVS